MISSKTESPCFGEVDDGLGCTGESSDVAQECSASSTTAIAAQGLERECGVGKARGCGRNLKRSDARAVAGNVGAGARRVLANSGDVVRRLRVRARAQASATMMLTMLQSAGVKYNGSSSNESTPAHGASSLSSLNGAAGPKGRSLASSQNVFTLDGYGARGDGKHDDTQALAKAWKAACASPRAAVVLVPRGKRYLLKVVGLSGPCKSSVVATVQGTLVASPNRSDWSDKDRRLTVNGGGAIDGNGERWWPHSCKINKALPCEEAPTALSFHSSNLTVENMKIVNSQQIHMSVEDCTDVQLLRLSITAPGTNPNTDGIHITDNKDVQVTNCMIKAGSSKTAVILRNRAKHRDQQWRVNADLISSDEV
ncbi:polygalacturonase-like [Phragmites australis]|uniref:polygalacturonase-like n=1 Tax=Phragmites australis TaxID=29695 RepID=UPI002D771664|nr:polygalacturonase-like [Phragmites australis]